jgi:hypothetical protein
VNRNDNSMRQKSSFDDQSVARKCVWLILATFTFLLCFYAGTAFMSMIYLLDEAPLGF